MCPMLAPEGLALFSWEFLVLGGLALRARPEMRQVVKFFKNFTTRAPPTVKRIYPHTYILWIVTYILFTF